MSIAYLESYLHRSPDAEITAFVNSSEFLQFTRIISSCFERNWAASFLTLALHDELMLTWMNGNIGRSGVGFTLTKSEDIRTDEYGNIILRRDSAYPAARITDELGNPTKPIEQLSIHTGTHSLSSYVFPPDVVVEKSGLLMGARYDHISVGSAGGIDIYNLASFGIRTHLDGTTAVYESGHFNPDATARLNMNPDFDAIAFYNILSTIS